MAAGVVPVVLSNPMESYMVKNGETGIVAENKSDYIKSIQNLYHNPDLRYKLSKNAKEFAIQNYSLDKFVNDWEKIFNEMVDIPKTIKNWTINKKLEEISAMDIFLESIGDYRGIFDSYINAINETEKMNAIEEIKKIANSTSWQSTTKGTLHHYHSFFPNDPYIAEWSKIMKKTNSLE